MTCFVILKGGPYFEIFTPQGKDVAANWKISGGIKKVWL